MSEPTTHQGHTRWVTSGQRTPTTLNYHMSFDPGENTGWASFDPSGKLTGSGILRNGIYGVSDFLGGLVNRPKVMIVETYRIMDFKHKHNMSKVPTIRVIGVLECYAYIHGAKWIEQEPSAKDSGVKWAGWIPPNGHMPDDYSAVGHGVYWLHKNGLWEIEL